jgi:hypothetical protein
MKNNVVFTQITERAQSIINKYKGKSSQGYIFPFAMNQYKWDMNDSESWRRWHNRKQATIEKIRAFLKKVAKHIGINPDDFIIYTFRHTAITHEVKSNKKPLMDIAKEAGTSVNMIESIYYKYLIV